HGHAGFVGGGDHLVVAHGTAGLDDGRRPGRHRRVDAVAEREEGIAGADAAPGPAVGLLGRHLGRVDPALLAGADAVGHAALGQDDGVAAGGGADLHGEGHVVELLVGGGDLRNDLPGRAVLVGGVGLLHEEAAPGPAQV